MTRLVLTLAPLALVLSASSVASAGAPLICFPIEIGEAKSLAWNKGNDPFGTKSGYDVTKKLVSDTLALLKTPSPLLVRMETLRRATCYLGQRHPNRERLALRLLTALQARALTAAAKKKRDGLAWFDAAYFSACLNQLRVSDAPRSDPLPWFERARRDGLKSPALDLALALVCYRAPEKHVAAAYRGSKANSAVRRQLERVYGHYSKALEKKEKKEKKGKKGKKGKKKLDERSKKSARKGRGKGRGKGKGGSKGGDAARP